MLKHVNNDNFEKEVLKSDKVTLVDFFATWCGPCSMIAPILEKIGKEKEEFDIAKVDIDESRDLAYKYDIAVVPTLVLFKNGQPIDTMEGAISEEEILKFVFKYLA